MEEEEGSATVTGDEERALLYMVALGFKEAKKNEGGFRGETGKKRTSE